MLAELTRVACRPDTGGNARRAYPEWIDGKIDTKTEAAIKLFQTDQQKRTGSTSTPVSGVIAPDGDSWRALVDGVCPSFKNLHVLPGGRTVFLGDTPERLAARVVYSSQYQLNRTFQRKLLEFIVATHKKYGMAMSICSDSGGFRTFEPRSCRNKKRLAVGRSKSGRWPSLQVQPWKRQSTHGRGRNRKANLGRQTDAGT